MRVLIYTYGTRGDVQPFLALCQALHAAGHTALLRVPADHLALAARHGVDAAGLDAGPNRFLDDPRFLRAFTETGQAASYPRSLAVLLRIMGEARPAMLRVLRDMAATADPNAEVVVHPPNLPGDHIAEWLGVPAVPVALQPVWAPTRRFANPLLPVHRLPGNLNRDSYNLTTVALRAFTGITTTWRRNILGLAARPGEPDPLRRRDGSRAPLLHAFSRHVLPQPLDYPSWVHTTGYWFLPAEQTGQPPTELTEFLAAGSPPVFVSFGSLPTAEPGQMGRMVCQALQRCGVRAVVATGRGGIEIPAPGSEVLVLSEVPHDWLFPQLAAIVHHGGAGTTAAAAAAGVPQVVCPFQVEQQFWARRMYAAGVAPQPLPGRHITAKRLTAAIQWAVHQSSARRRARELSGRLRAEDGPGAAVAVLASEVQRAQQR